MPRPCITKVGRLKPAKDELLVRLENVLAKEVLHVGGINGALLSPLAV